jgi:hypothetical protein
MTHDECWEHTMQVDRKNSWRQLHHMPLLQQDRKGSRHLTDTILDGEYVVDTDAVTGAMSAHDGSVAVAPAAIQHGLINGGAILSHRL